MAPEVSSGESEKVGPASDVFSYAILLWELLANTFRPYGRQRQIEMIHYQVAHNPNFRPNLNHLRLNGCPRWIRNLVQMCWQHDHTVRPSAQRICQTFSRRLQQMKSRVRCKFAWVKNPVCVRIRGETWKLREFDQREEEEEEEEGERVSVGRKWVEIEVERKMKSLRAHELVVEKMAGVGSRTFRFFQKVASRENIWKEVLCNEDLMMLDSDDDPHLVGVPASRSAGRAIVLDDDLPLSSANETIVEVVRLDDDAPSLEESIDGPDDDDIEMLASRDLEKRITDAKKRLRQLKEITDVYELKLGEAKKLQ